MLLALDTALGLSEVPHPLGADGAASSELHTVVSPPSPRQAATGFCFQGAQWLGMGGSMALWSGKGAVVLAPRV